MPRVRKSKTSQVGRDYFWNTAASFMMSLATVILTVVVTRSAGLAAAGVFGLAYQAGQQFQPLGMYEIRPYQVTDLQHRFSFGSYLATRIVTVVLMILGIIGYAVLFGDGPSDMLLIVLIASLRGRLCLRVPAGRAPRHRRAVMVLALFDDSGGVLRNAHCHW